jgi:benzil reductase ((S)-benzoin forming)
MDSALFLITGTSRGIGHALARKVAQEGHSVLGIARTAPDPPHPSIYHHLAVDLGHTSGVEAIIAKAEEIFDAGRYDFVCLVNSASAVEPVGPVERCGAEDIESHLTIGLLTPVLLTSRFMRRFAGKAIRRKIAFISSGAAFTPLPDESIYCTAKAGLQMFAQCIGLEQRNHADGFEIVSIGPGMVDTAMQLAVRSKSPDEFAMADIFKQAFADGRLQDPTTVAEKIYAILQRTSEPGQFVNANDV